MTNERIVKTLVREGYALIVRVPCIFDRFLNKFIDVSFVDKLLNVELEKCV